MRVVVGALLFEHLSGDGEGSFRFLYIGYDMI